MGNSNCATDNYQKEYLYKLLGGKWIVTTLLYRASNNGCKARTFHTKCDHREPTIILLKIRDGDCFGGFTKF